MVKRFHIASLRITDVGAEGDNVFVGDNGELYFVDPIIQFKKPAKDVESHSIMAVMPSKKIGERKEQDFTYVPFMDLHIV